MLGKVNAKDGCQCVVSPTRDIEGAACSDDSSYPKPDLVEHDYIGLSGTLLPVGLRSTKSMSSSASDEPGRKDAELKCEDTELRLGIGSVYGGNASASSVASVTASQNESNGATRQLLKERGTGLDAMFPCRRGSNIPAHVAMEFEQAFVPWLAPGGFSSSNSKVTASAKRPFVEVASSNVGDGLPASDLNTKPSLQSAGPQLSVVTTSSHGGHCTRTHISSCGNLQSSPNPSGTYARSDPFANRHLPVASLAFKVPSSRPAIHYNLQWPSAPPSAVPLCPSSSLPDSRVSVSTHNGQDTGRTSKSVFYLATLAKASWLSQCNAHCFLIQFGFGLIFNVMVYTFARAPVVGWPPVRSFRKNNMHAGSAHLTSKAPSDLQGCQDANANLKTVEAGGDLDKVNSKDNLYVKAKLDGFCICRKVDITAYDNYEGLKSALQEMFQGFVVNDNPPLDLLQGENYVLTHEDKDGDCMLVGDVPWRLFVTTVKSLRIMRTADAVGLGKRVRLNA